MRPACTHAKVDCVWKIEIRAKGSCQSQKRGRGEAAATNQLERDSDDEVHVESSSGAYDDYTSIFLATSDVSWETPSSMAMTS